MAREGNAQIASVGSYAALRAIADIVISRSNFRFRDTQSLRRSSRNRRQIIFLGIGSKVVQNI